MERSNIKSNHKLALENMTKEQNLCSAGDQRVEGLAGRRPESRQRHEQQQQQRGRQRQQQRVLGPHQGGRHVRGWALRDGFMTRFLLHFLNPSKLGPIRLKLSYSGNFEDLALKASETINLEIMTI